MRRVLTNSAFGFLFLVVSISYGAEVNRVPILQGNSIVKPLNGQLLLPRCYMEASEIPGVAAKLKAAEKLLESLDENVAALKELTGKSAMEKLARIKEQIEEIRKLESDMEPLFPEKFRKKDRIRTTVWHMPEFSSSQIGSFLGSKGKSSSGSGSQLNELMGMASSGSPKNSEARAVERYLRVRSFKAPQNPFGDEEMDKIMTDCESGLRPEAGSFKANSTDAEIEVNSKAGTITLTENLSLAQSCLLTTAVSLWALVEERSVAPVQPIPECSYKTGPILLYSSMRSERIVLPEGDLTPKDVDDLKRKKRPPVHSF